MTVPTPTPIAINFKSNTSEDANVAAIAMSIPRAAKKFPLLAVFGCDKRFNPRIKQTADMR